MNHDTGPPTLANRVKEYVWCNVIVLLAYVGLAAMLCILSSGIGKITYLTPPPNKHVAMAYYQNHNNNESFKTVFHYRL